MTNPCPGYPVTTAYGVPGSWARGYHTGEDRACPSGSRVVAATAGRVVGVGWEGDYGNTVQIETSGVRHMYCHLSGFTCWVGQDVDAGQLIGYAGSTGNSTGPHLHYEERWPSPFPYGSDRRPQFPDGEQSQPQPEPEPIEEDDDMKIVCSTGRGCYLLAGGYWRWMDEENKQAFMAIGVPVFTVNDRQIDVLHAGAVYGEAANHPPEG